MEIYSANNSPARRRKLSFLNATYDTRDQNDSKVGMTMHHRRRNSRMSKKILKMKDFSTDQVSRNQVMKTHREPEKGKLDGY